MLWERVRGCPFPLPEEFVHLYLANPVFAMLVDFVAAVTVLWFARLLVRPLRSRLHGWRLWLAWSAAAAWIVLFHEYLKEGYFFKLSDLKTFPPRTHESFLAFLLLLSTLFARLGVLAP